MTPTNHPEPLAGPITQGEYNIRVRLRPDQLERIRELAKANERNVTQEVRYAVERYLEANHAR